MNLLTEPINAVTEKTVYAIINAPGERNARGGLGNDLRLSV